MALMQITVIPLGTKTASVGDWVAGIESLLREKGIPHELGDMGTVIQGEVEELLILAGEVHALGFHQGVERVVTSILLDERRDQERGIGEKKEAVLRRLHGKTTSGRQEEDRG